MLSRIGLGCSINFFFSFGHSAAIRELIEAFCDVFSCSRVPDTIFTDNGTQFASHEIVQFLERWQVKHVTSSLHYLQSNGRAEATVKSVKKMIRSCWNSWHQSLDQERWSAAMLQYHNIPVKNWQSPAEILHGHPVQDMIPAHRCTFDRSWQPSTETAASQSTQRSSTTMQQQVLYSLAYWQGGLSGPHLWFMVASWK